MNSEVTAETAPEHTAYQACFVVADVAAAVEFCRRELGWGPFQHFTIPSPDSKYHGWQGYKLTEVALGMAGRSQVELIQVHQGRDAIEDYQTRIGPGLQHLGVLVKSTQQSLSYLTAAGAVKNDSNQYGEITYTFIDIPKGPAMLELLERGEQGLPTKETGGESIGKTAASSNETLQLDRATIVTNNIQQSTEFLSHCFGTDKPKISDDTLREQFLDSPPIESAAKRCLLDAGVLQIELVEVDEHSDSVYARQLKRARGHSDHGLMHVGGSSDNCVLPGEPLHGEWLGQAEKFQLFAGPDNRLSLQVRA